MVITSTPSNGSSTTAIEQAEPVKDEPPIGAQRQPVNQQSTNEKAAGAGTPASSREDLCKNAHVNDVAYLSAQLEVDVNHGLSNHEAASRLQKDGPNKIKDSEGISVFQILLRQVSNSLTLVLVITTILSFSLNDYIEAAVILAVIFLNIVVGFIQDYRAEQTILSLQALSSPECKVLRGEQIQVVKAETLVVGDVVLLAAGAVVPADLRLFDSVNLSTDEALLTGESLPISKFADQKLTRADVPIGDRTNMVYSASMVTRGRGSGIVIATAMLTEVGKIAALLQDKKASNADANVFQRFYRRTIEIVKHALGLVGSPLQVKLSKFALLLFGLAILLAVIVFSTAKWDVSDEVLIYGICVAVAVIPESLIAVLTLTIAVGTKAMARSNIIIRKLSSLEAVGGVTNICSDKTGTLTQGKMIVRRALVKGSETLSVQNSTNPFDPTSGTVEREDGNAISDVQAGTPLDLYLDIVSLCNLSTVQNLSRTVTGSSKPAGTLGQGGWTAVGEPTEVALQVFAMRFEHGKAEAMAKKDRTLLGEFPFDSSIKRMTMAYTRPADNVVDLFTKGATEAVLSISNCTEEEIARITADADAMASQGLRVLCLAHKTVSPDDEKAVADRDVAETGLNFVGLIGLYDPPRAETADAVRTCQRAGITVHMLTGDHIRTATAIAQEVGIVGHGHYHMDPTSTGEVMLASDFDKLNDDQLDQLEKLPLVVARCSPTTKVRMVQALHRRQAFCIMTGDGINDSPALKLADIGIAMGLNGSDVAKQAADMVLADDNFASIVRAIQEGRRLFDNIQKFLLHLLTSNIAQVVLLIIALAFQDANQNSVFPLSPLEILWANLVTSSPLALGLGLEASVVDIMDRPPRDTKVGVFTKSLIIDKMVYGITMGSLCLVAFVSVIYGIGSGEHSLGEECNQDYNGTCDRVFEARATVFAVLSFTLLITAWEVKDFNASLFNMGLIGVKRDPESSSSKIFSVFPAVYQNKFLFWAVVSGFILVFPLIYIPEVNTTVFKHKGITYEWGIVVGCLVMYVAVIESWKAIKRFRVKQTQRRNGESGKSTPQDGSSVV